MATNLVTYIGNLGKSVGYATIDKFKKVSPTTTEFIETNAELYKSVTDAIVDYKNTYKRGNAFLKNSKVYEAGDVYLHAIFEDISTGKFYNKERQNKMDERALGMSNVGGDDEWGSLDMSGGFDESQFDIGSDEDFGSFTAGDEMVASSVEKSSKKNADAVSMAIARTGEYIVENQRINSNMIFTQNMQAYGNMTAGLNAINDNIGKVLSFSNSVLQTHAENSQKYYEATTAMMQEQTGYLKQIAEALAPKHKDDKKKERITIDDIIGVNGAPSMSMYAKQVQKNFGNIMSGILPTTGIGEGNTLLSLVAQPLQFIPNMIVNKLVPKIVEDSITQFDKSLSGAFGALMSKANTMSKSDNFIQSTIGKLFGISNNAKNDINTANYEKGKVSWDGKSKRALEEVIPAHLARIESLLSGKGEKRYDYDRGKFVDVKSLGDSFKGIEKNYINKATSDMKDEFSKYMDLITFSRLEEKQQFDKDIQKIFSYLYRNNEIFDMNNKDFDDLAFKYDVNGKNLRLFRRLFKETPRHTQMNLNRNIMENRQAQTNHMNRLEEEGSVYSHLFNGLDINEFVNHNKNTGEVKSKGLLGSLSNNLKDSLDEKGHNLFYYLRNINRELTFMRQNGFGGGRGSSGSKGSIMTGSDGKSIHLRGADFNDIQIEDDSKPSLSKIYNDSRYREEQSFARQQNRLRDKDEFRINFSDFDGDEKHADFRLRDAIALRRTKLMIEDERAKQKNKKSDFIEELLESDSLIKKYQKMKERGSNVLKKPMDFISNVFRKADQRLYEAIYGTSDGKGFLDLLVEGTKKTFKRLNDWMDDKILEPLKKKLDIKEFKDLGKKFFGMFGINTDDFGKRFKTYFFGNKDTGEKGLFSEVTAGIRESFGSVKTTIKDAVSGTFKDITQPFRDRFKNRKKAIKDLANDEDSYDDIPTEAVSDRIPLRRHAVTDNSSREELIKLSREARAIKNRLNYGTSLNIDRDMKRLQNISAKIDNIRSNQGKGNIFNNTNRVPSPQSKLDQLFSHIGLNVDSKYYDSLLGFNEGKDIDNMSLDDIIGNISYGRGNWKTKADMEKMKKGLESYRGSAIKSRGLNSISINDILKYKYEPVVKEQGKSTSELSDRASAFLDIPEDGSSGHTDKATSYLKDIRDFLFSLKGKGNVAKGKFRPTSVFSPAPVFDANIDPSENNVMWDKSKGLAEVIMKFLSGNTEHHKAGTPILKESQLATLKEGEMVLNPEQAKSIVSLMNSITGKVELGKDKLSDIAADSYTKFSRLKDASGFKFNELDKLSGDERKLLTDNGFDFNKLQGLVVKKYNRLMDALEEQFKLDTDLDKNGEPKDPVQKALFESVKPFTFQMLDEFKKGVSGVKKSLFGDSPKDDKKAIEKAITDVSENISEYAPKMVPAALIGSGVSLLTGMIGGPLLGAAVGAGTSLAMNSDKVKDWLFGEKIADERQGGAISKGVIDAFTKYFPDAKKYGLTGALAGMITPFGPVGGLFLGAGASFVKNNASMQDLLFGEKGLFNERDKEKFKKILPRMGLGLLAGTALGPFGIVGNAFLGAGAGFMTTSNKFNEVILGKFNPTTKRYEDGILPALRESVVDPLKNFGGDMKDKFFDFLQKDIFDPLKSSFEPLKKDSKLLINGIFRGLGNAFDFFFEQAWGVPFRKVAHDATAKVSSFIKGFFAKAIINPAKFIVSAPFKAIGKLGESRRRRHVATGNADYMTAAERIDYAQENGITSSLGNFDDVLANGDASSISDLKNAFGSFMDLKKSDKDKNYEIGQETIDKLSPYVNASDLGKMLKMFKNGTDADAIKKYKAKSINNSKATISKIYNEVYDYYTNGIQKIYKKAKSKNLSDREVNILKINLKDDIKRKYLKELPSNTQKEILDKLESAIDENGNSISSKQTEFFNHISGMHNNVVSKSSDMDGIIDEQFDKLKNFRENKNNRDAVTSDFSNTLRKFGINIDMNNPKQLEKAYNMINKEMDRIKTEQKMESRSGESSESKGSEWNQQLAFSKLVEEQNKNRHKDITSLFMQAINGIRQMNGQDPLKVSSDFSHGDVGKLEEKLNRATNGVNGLKGAAYKSAVLRKLPHMHDGFISEDMSNTKLDEADKNGIIHTIQDGEMVEFKRENDGSISPDLSDPTTKKWSTGRMKEKIVTSSAMTKLANFFDAKKDTKENNKDKKEKKSGGLLDTILSFFGGAGSSVLKTGGLIAGVGLLTKIFADTGFGKVMTDKVIPAIGEGAVGIIQKATPTLVNLIATGLSAALPVIFSGLKAIVSTEVKSLFPEIFGNKDDNKYHEAIDNSLAGNGIVRNVVKGNTESFAKIADKFSFNKGKNMASTVGKIFATPLRSITKLTLGTSAKVFGKAADVVKTFSSRINNSSILTKARDSITKNVESKTGSLLEKVYSVGDTSIAKTFTSKLENFLTELVTNPVVSKFIPGKVQDIIEKFIPKLTMEISERAAKDSAKIASRMAAITTTGGLATVAFGAADFVSGYNDAANIFGVSEDSMGDLGIGYKVGAGLMKAMNGAFLISSFIPEDVYVNLVCDYLLPIFNIDNSTLQKKRDDAKKEIDDYNKKNGTNYTTRQYNSEVKGHKTILQKMGFGLDKSTLNDIEAKDPDSKAFMDEADRKSKLSWWDNAKDNLSSLGNQVSGAWSKFTKFVGFGGQYDKVNNSDNIVEGDRVKNPTTMYKNNYKHIGGSYDNAGLYEKQRKNLGIDFFSGMGGPDDSDSSSTGSMQQSDVSTNDDFLKYMVPAAQDAYKKYGIFPSVMIAQAINESGWGKSKLAKTDNNLFGIKIPGNHDPDSNATQGTWATDDGGYYAHYPSWSDSIKDHGFFLKNNSRYQKAFTAKDPQEQIQDIKDAGYASDPSYVDTTMSIINSNKLTQYDSGLQYTGSSGSSDSSSSDSGGNMLTDALGIFSRAVDRFFGTGDKSSSSSSSGGGSASITVRNAPDAIKKALEFAVSKVGCPYVWGGTGEALTEDTVQQFKGTDHDITKYNGANDNWKNWIGKEGYDCSGLTSKAYAAGGVDIGRSTYDQVKQGSPVSQSDIKPGDLIFFGSASAPHHVAMYIGNGKMVQAPKSGDTVNIVDISSRSDISGFRRMVESSTDIQTTVNGSTTTSAASANATGDSVGGEYDYPRKPKIIDIREANRKKKQQLQTPYGGIGGAADNFFSKTLGGNVTSGFGYRNTTGRISKNHTGIDIGAKDGQNIDAPIGGIVTKKLGTEDSNGLGNLLVLKDKFGGEHMFGHMKNPSNLKPGDTVDPGDKIGQVGSTGNSTGSHLHYETRVNGRSVNPNDYLSGKNPVGGEKDNSSLNNDSLQTIIGLLTKIADNTVTLNTIVTLIQTLVGNKSNTTTDTSTSSTVTAATKDAARNTGNQLASLLGNKLSNSSMDESDLYNLLAQIAK